MYVLIFSITIFQWRQFMDILLHVHQVMDKKTLQKIIKKLLESSNKLLNPTILNIVLHSSSLSRQKSVKSSIVQMILSDEACAERVLSLVLTSTLDSQCIRSMSFLEGTLTDMLVSAKKSKAYARLAAAYVFFHPMHVQDVIQFVNSNELFANVALVLGAGINGQHLEQSIVAPLAKKQHVQAFVKLYRNEEDSFSKNMILGVIQQIHNYAPSVVEEVLLQVEMLNFDDVCLRTICMNGTTAVEVAAVTVLRCLQYLATHNDQSEATHMIETSACRVLREQPSVLQFLNEQKQQQSQFYSKNNQDTVVMQYIDTTISTKMDSSSSIQVVLCLCDKYEFDGIAIDYIENAILNNSHMLAATLKLAKLKPSTAQHTLTNELDIMLDSFVSEPKYVFGNNKQGEKDNRCGVLELIRAVLRVSANDTYKKKRAQYLYFAQNVMNLYEATVSDKDLLINDIITVLHAQGVSIMRDVLAPLHMDDVSKGWKLFKNVFSSKKRLTNTIQLFPVKLQLYAAWEEAKKSISSNVDMFYDPRYVLRFALYLIIQTQDKPNHFEAITCLAIPLAIRATSSEDLAMRQLAFEVLQHFIQILKRDMDDKVFFVFSFVTLLAFVQISASIFVVPCFGQFQVLCAIKLCSSCISLFSALCPYFASASGFSTQRFP